MVGLSFVSGANSTGTVFNLTGSGGGGGEGRGFIIFQKPLNAVDLSMHR